MAGFGRTLRRGVPSARVVYYLENDGSVPFVEWLASVAHKASAKCQAYVARLQSAGHELRTPIADYLRDGIHELRPSLGGVHHRILERRPGGSFKLFGGRIEGRNIGLAPNQRMVQEWRPSSWPAGVYTVVRFDLVARGSGTRIIFDQAGLLEDEAEWKHLNEGWPRNYWDPLRKYLDV